MGGDLIGGDRIDSSGDYTAEPAHSPEDRQARAQLIAEWTAASLAIPSEALFGGRATAVESKMGGTHGEIRGSSKAEAYQKYVELVDGFGGTFESRYPDPKYKKECKRLMVEDPDTGKWVLRYPLHT
ncbi:hypothetical protein [Arhodomonas sp. AD133]|uniref:hypothetical protein n=1 Tax=Arhodomonas sp. AD133 TaxID=3415009 RepID=UPI003EBB208C